MRRRPSCSALHCIGLLLVMVHFCDDVSIALLAPGRAHRPTSRQDQACPTSPNQPNTPTCGRRSARSPPSTARPSSPRTPGRPRPQNELWADLGKRGFIGINVPEQYGGGGAGMAELAVVAEESAAGGSPLLLLLVSSAISVEVLSRHGSAEQQRSGCRGWPPAAQDGLRHHRAGCRIQLAPALHDRPAGRRRLPDHRAASTTSPASTSPPRSSPSPAPASTRPPVAARMSMFIVPTDAAGLSWQPLPVAAQIPDRQFTVFYDEVRVPASALIGAEGEGLPAAVRRAQSGADHRRRARASASAGTRSTRPPSTRSTSVGVGRADRRPPGRGAPAGQGQGRGRAGRADDGEGGLAARQRTGRPARRPTWPSTRPRRPRWPRSTPRSRPTAATGCPPSTDCVPLWGMARLLRIAPVNREMVLNYVAQHTLGLPRSY